MEKKRILAGFLAGMMALSVTACGKTDDDEEKAEKVSKSDSNNIESALQEAEDRVQSTADTVDKAIKGELDFAYAGSAKVEFGSFVTKEAGTEIKPITIVAGTKQRGQKTQADVSVAYDTTTLASLNAVVDNEEQVTYLKVPELSDAYIAVTPEEIQNMFAEQIEQYKQELDDATSVNIGDTEFNAEELTNILSELDFDALFEDFESYCELVADKIPEGKENGTLSGDIGGNSYEYDVITIDVTGQVVFDIADAVANKAKDDQLLKDTFAKFGVGNDTYNSAVDEFLGEIKQADQEDLSQTLLTVDLYKLGDDVYGFSFAVPEENLSMKLVTIDEDNAVGVDFVAAEDGKEVASVKGAFTNNDDVVNGSMAVAVSDEVNANFTITDLKPEGDLFSGTISASIAADGESVSGTIVSTSTEDKLDIKVSADANGENIFVITLEGEATDASDITIPTGTIYHFNEADLEAYINSCDTEGFMNRIANALGADLSEQLA